MREEPLHIGSNARWAKLMQAPSLYICAGGKALTMCQTQANVLWSGWIATNQRRIVRREVFATSLNNSHPPVLDIVVHTRENLGTVSGSQRLEGEWH